MLHFVWGVTKKQPVQGNRVNSHIIFYFFRYMHFLCFVQYFVPLILISFAYIRIAVVLWGSKIPGAAQDQRDQIVLKNKKKVFQ